LLGAVFSASPDAVIVVDDRGNIVLSSPAVTELFGYYPEELVGESIETLIPVDRATKHAEHLRHFFEMPRARLMGAGLELAGRHRDGLELPVEVSLAPVEVRGTRYAAAFVRDARERQRGIDRLHAVNEITQRLLGGTDVADIVPLISRRARRLCVADAVWTVQPVASGELEITSVDGPGTEVLLGVELSSESSRSAETMRSGASQVVEDLSLLENVPRGIVDLNLGPGLFVPLVADERHLGTLVLGRVRGAPQFEPLDVAFAEVFATATASAIELGTTRAELERVSIVAQNERIARDLHDTVIQQLFAIGLSLQAGRAMAVGPLGSRIDDAVNNLDVVIREIRNTIFRLPGRSEAAADLRDQMIRLADKFFDELGFHPRVALHSAVGVSVPDIVSSHVLQVLGEALSNIARHAQASFAEAIVTIEDRVLSFSIVDDGIGMADGPTAGQGLRNMEARAAELGGSCTITGRQPTGTIIQWRVPL
jgi:PAS domain S-box-containing protein